jgi:hypothetical protein
MQLLGLGSIPVFIVFFWRWYKKRRQHYHAVQEEAQFSESPVYPGEDSEFYDVIRQLEELGIVRESGESLSQWLTRLEMHFPFLPLQTLRCILNLHYRYRFDPAGLSAEEREILRSRVQSWMKQVEEKDLLHVTGEHV